MTEPTWMTEAIRMIQRHGNQPDAIERARMEIAIYRHLQAQRDSVLEEAAVVADSLIGESPAVLETAGQRIRALKTKP